MNVQLKLNARPRGLVKVSADGSNATEILAKLQAAFETFKAENDANLKAKFADVVQTEKVERINAEISALQGEIDKMNAKLAAGQVNGSDKRVHDAEYTEAFKAQMRMGDRIKDDAILASLNKGTAAEGGYTTPVEWDRTINDELKLVSPVRQLMSVKTVGVHAASKLINKHGTTSGWVGETAARPETAASTLQPLNITWGEIYAMPSATQQILDDSLIDLEKWLSDEVLLEFAQQEGAAVISGNGTNKPNGILTYVTGGTNADSHPSGAITVVASGAVGAVTFDGIQNLVYDLPTQFTGNAAFAMNRNTVGKIRILKDTTNNYLWQPSNVLGTPASLLGYPAVEVPDMPNVATNAKSILFGDFKRTYEIYDRIGIRVLRDPYTAKPYVLFYTTKRLGGICVNPQAMRALNIG